MKSKVINGFLRFIFDMIGVIVTFIMAIGFMIAYAFYEGITARVLLSASSWSAL